MSYESTYKKNRKHEIAMSWTNYIVAGLLILSVGYLMYYFTGQRNTIVNTTCTTINIVNTTCDSTITLIK